MGFDLGALLKDVSNLGTGREQHITITSSSNMSKDDIEKAVKEAEQYAAEDKKRREEVDIVNGADQMVYTCEKALTDMGDKLEEGEKAPDIEYKDVVVKNLSSNNCGLSVNYKDWPGNSQIVIPLFDIKDGGLSTVDTSVISDSQVVKHMQYDDDKNIESRKDMVDLKEREAEKASEKAQESQKNAVQEQKKLNEEKEKALKKFLDASLERASSLYPLNRSSSKSFGI